MYVDCDEEAYYLASGDDFKETPEYYWNLAKWVCSEASKNIYDVQMDIYEQNQVKKPVEYKWRPVILFDKGGNIIRKRFAKHPNEVLENHLYSLKVVREKTIVDIIWSEYISGKGGVND